MARQIVVDIVGDNSKFSNTLDDASTKTGKFGDTVKGIGMGIGFGAFSLASDAVMGFVGSLGEAGEAYRSDQTSQSLLQNTLRNTIPGWDGNTDAIEAYASAQAARGFEDDAVRESLGQLVGITHDSSEAMELNTLAQDLARSKGIDLASATDIVTKAAQGNGKALKALGVDIGDATDAAGMLDAIQQNAAGSADAWAATSEGRLAAAQVKQGEAWEQIGGIVDRIQGVVMPLFADALTVVADALTWLSGVLEPVFVLFEELGTIVGGFVEQFTSGAGKVGESGNMLGEIIDSITGIFQGAFDIIKAGTEATFAIVGAIWDVFGEHIMDSIGFAIDFITNSFSNFFDVIEGIFDVFAGIFTGDWDRVFDGIKGIVGGVFDQIRNIVDTALKIVGSLVKTVFSGLVDWLSGLPRMITNAVSGLFDGIPKAFKAALNWLIGMWNNLSFTIGPFDLGPLGKIGPWTLSTPNIPKFHSGGVVPGTPGSDVLAVLQAGERVIPRSQGGNAGITIVINGDVYGDGIDQLSDKIALRLRLAGA